MNTKTLKMRIIFTFLLFIVLFSFTSFAQTYSISGTIRDESGAPMEGIKVSLYGNASQTTTTDNNGFYIFSGLPRTGEFSVVPSNINYSFDPRFKNTYGLISDQIWDFVGKKISLYSISGTIRDTDGELIIGVTVTLSGHTISRTTTTDNNGFYTFSNLPESDDYLVTPSHNNYSFDSPNGMVSGLDSDQTWNFIGTEIIRYTISGTIRDVNGMSISGIRIYLDYDIMWSYTTTTDDNGFYIFSDLMTGPYYRVSPGYNNYYSFEPSKRMVGVINSNIENIDFIASEMPLDSIYGTIRDSDGIPISNVTITLFTLSDSVPRTVITDDNGSYTFSGLAIRGYYVITPSHSDYIFDPIEIIIYDLSFSSNRIYDFTAVNKSAYLSITGTIRDATGKGISGIIVNSTITDNNGCYTLSNLTAGGSYVVAPHHDRHSFDPPGIWFERLVSNKIVDFIMGPEIPLYIQITGTIKDANGKAISGVEVDISGIYSGTTITDNNGYYIFSKLSPKYTYEVAAYHNNYSFEPHKKSFYNIQSDQIGDFVATSLISVDNITELPTGYSLEQNYPNPFNPSTKIKYAIKESGFVSIQLFDIFGREVKKLVNTYQQSGHYEITFDAANLTSGVYYYKLNINDFTETKKMMLMK